MSASCARMGYASLMRIRDSHSDCQPVQNAGPDLVSSVGEAERTCALLSVGISSQCCDAGGSPLAGMVAPHSASM